MTYHLRKRVSGRPDFVKSHETLCGAPRTGWDAHWRDIMIDWRRADDTPMSACRTCQAMKRTVTFEQSVSREEAKPVKRLRLEERV